MRPTRREFLYASGLAAGAIGAGDLDPDGRPLLQGPGRAAAPLRILILGGTGFIGPHQVRNAVARGHHVTLFNRGRTNPGLFKGLPNIEERVGDRAPTPGNYDSLKDGRWDVVIDNPTTRPRWVREAAAAVRGRADHYVFISTISVYARNDEPGADESAAVATTATPDVESGPEFPPLYGPLKALSEREAQRAFPGRATIIRPGLIVGVGDTTDRFTYWPVRIARGGEVLAPPAGDPVQIIDARDLSEWVIRCCERKVYGVFNATGPRTRFGVGQMLEGIRDTLGARATFVHVTPAFLERQDPPVNAWTDLPVWVPASGETAGFTQRSIAKALAAGLTFRPFPDTVRETMAFYRQQSDERKAQLRAGLSEEREAAALAAWKARTRK
ncbi:MAG: twin-arginine translocation signal domain-containing protein [Vicinamibacterales bacterium]